jgi:hypothetical protein
VSKKSQIKPEQVMLYTHFVVADAIKAVVTAPIKGEEKCKDHPMAMPALMLSSFYRILVYYALLYVVVEAYEKCEDKSQEIDEILNGDMKDKLRRLRNAMFHVQDEPFNPKLWNFLLTSDSENWIKKLGLAFEKYFLGNIPVLQETINEFK